MTTTNGNHILNHIGPDEVAVEIKDPVDPQALDQAKAILDELRGGKGAGLVFAPKLLEIGKRLGDITEDSTKYVVPPEECKAAFDSLTDQERSALVSIHGRVKAFAEAQRATVKDMQVPIPGGFAGHTVSPCKGTSFYEDDHLENDCATEWTSLVEWHIADAFFFRQLRGAMLQVVVIPFLRR